MNDDLLLKFFLFIVIVNDTFDKNSEEKKCNHGKTIKKKVVFFLYIYSSRHCMACRLSEAEFFFLPCDMRSREKKKNDEPVFQLCVIDF